MTSLTLGFIPLTDCAPLVVAEAKGFFAGEGLDVTLSREASWATIRDKVTVGALDAAHMLAPMALAATAGAGGPVTPMIAPLALAVNGAGVTLSNRLSQALPAGAETLQEIAAGLAAFIGQRRVGGEPPLTFAVVFPYSMHNYALRYWLAEAGVDLDRDVRLVVTPPPRMVEQLRTGQVDGVCVGAPWNAVATRGGLGRVVMRTSQFWPAGPDKVLGAGAAFAQDDRLSPLLRALVRAQAWCDRAENHEDLAVLLAQPEYVGAPPDAISAALGGELVFHRDGAGIPRLEHARWFLAQMRRWNQIGADVDAQALIASVYRPDLAMAALKATGLAPEVQPAPGPLFDGKTFAAG
ncbi:CmpA/NrtA family ABC transporter substrate-binding protein [Phenylobacterium sp.]|uniref:CmpA/NrtA family ABC transporter substrate-binding protein n=1 Tax=Phenylobacterium sp. TaxID=1871053 RepID=UPI0030F44EF0